MDSRANGGPILGQPSPLKDILRAAVTSHPDQNAVACLHQYGQEHSALPRTGGKSTEPFYWTYASLWRAAGFLAEKLSSLTSSDDGPVAMISYNCAEWPLFLWMSIRANRPFVPLDPRSLSRATEIEHILKLIKPAILVAADENIATTLHSKVPSLIDAVNTKILLSSHVLEDQCSTFASSWTSLFEIFSSFSNYDPDHDPTTDLNGTVDDIALIIFTSGTTGLPKACPHSNKNLWAAIQVGTKMRDLDINRSLLQYLPASHIFAVVPSIVFWANSATVVYPSASFDVASSLTALDMMRCTDLNLVPSILLAFLNHPKFNTRLTAQVVYCGIGGTMITPDMLESARSPKQFGVPNTYTGFGMSEGYPMLRWNPGETSLGSNGRFLSMGTPAMGCHVEICDQKTGDILPRGDIGELRVSGDMIIDGYLDISSSSFFAKRDGSKWLATGDQAMMDDSGNVFVVGRYKDIIIRGGENISPAVIETVINQIGGVTSQVFAIPDAIAGEVPAVVLQLKDNVTVDKEAILRRVGDECGASHIPALVMTLKELQLQSFPMTSTGKVQKDKLRQIVEEYMASETDTTLNQSGNSESSTTAKTLYSVWAQVLGQEVDTIAKLPSVLDCADSITIMRVRHQVRKLLQKDISIEDLMHDGGIGHQAKILEGSPTLRLEGGVKQDTRRGPLKMDEIAMSLKKFDVAEQVKKVAEPMLSSLNLSWDDDVEDILPVTDWGRILLRRLRPQSWNHRHTYGVARIPPQEVQHVLEMALANHPMLRTLAVKLEDNTYCHLVIRPSTCWAKNCFTHLAEVDSMAAVPLAGLNDPELDYAAIGGPLVRILIVPVHDPPMSTGFTYQLNHSVFDGLSLPGFIEDVEALLRDRSCKLSIRVPYKLYADMYYIHYDSLIAKQGVKILAEKYRGLADLRHALWPVQRAPEWFKGCDRGWIHSNGTPGTEYERVPIDGASAQGVLGLSRSMTFPHLAEIRDLYNIEPYLVFKTALVLLNITQTGQSTALFTNYQAARTWPFVEDFIGKSLPNTLDIAGPTFEVAINALTVSRQETIKQLLERVKKEQEVLTRHAHAPLRALQQTLSTEDGDMVLEITRRQIFNWLPLPQSRSEDKERKLQRLQTLSRSDVGILFNCGLRDAQTFWMNASYDDAQLGAADVKGILDNYFVIAKWISQPQHFSELVDSALATIRM